MEEGIADGIFVDLLVFGLFLDSAFGSDSLRRRAEIVGALEIDGKTDGKTDGSKDGASVPMRRSSSSHNFCFPNAASNNGLSLHSR